MRLFASAALLLAALVLGGCVWLRLLALKEQLADFDRGIVAEGEGAALVLRFRQPCVRVSDIGYLLGSEPPTRRDQDADGAWWHTWELERSAPEAPLLEVSVAAASPEPEAMVERIAVPPAILACIGRARLLALARAFGRAEVDRERREASAALDAASGPPPFRAAAVRAALGDPDALEQSDDAQRWRYRFRVRGDGSAAGPCTLWLEARGEALLAIGVVTPRFHATARFEAR